MSDTTPEETAPTAYEPGDIIVFWDARGKDRLGKVVAVNRTGDQVEYVVEAELQVPVPAKFYLDADRRVTFAHNEPADEPLRVAEANADYPSPNGQFEAPPARPADFDPLPLSVSDPAGDLAGRAMVLLCSSNPNEVLDAAKSHEWHLAVRWWLDQYNSWNHRTVLLTNLEQAALAQSGAIARAQRVHDQVQALIGELRDGGVDDQAMTDAIGRAQARYAAAHPEEPQPMGDRQ